MSPLPPSQLMLPHRPGWKHRAGPQGLQTPLTLSPRREPAGGAGLTVRLPCPSPGPGEINGPFGSQKLQAGGPPLSLL